MADVVQESYLYDGHGRRVVTWRADGTSAVPVYGLDGKVRLTADNFKGGLTSHVYLGDDNIADVFRRWSDGQVTTTYLHTDALGSPVARTNAAGTVLSPRTVYAPYGQVVAGEVEGIGYTGHLHDATTDLVYMQQRYYDPAVGRFLSSDPVTTDGNTGGNFNRYSYANNNPYGFTDPDGRFSWEIFADAFKAEISGGVTLEVKLKLGPLAEGGLGLGSMTGGFGASGTDGYSFLETSGPSGGITVLDKVQLGLTPSIGRTEGGRYDVPFREVTETGSFGFDVLEGDMQAGSNGELSAEVGFIFAKIKVGVDLGQAAYGLFVASPDEIPAQQEEAQVEWQNYRSDASQGWTR